MALSDQGTWAGTSGGSANAQTLTVPNVTSLADLLGVSLRFIAGYSNTAALTFAPSGLAATAVKQISTTGLAACVGGEVIAGNLVTVVYDGTQFILGNAIPSVVSAHYGADGGSVNAITSTMTPAISGYSEGQYYILTGLAATNTGNVTANFNGVGSRQVLLPSGAQIPAYMITINETLLLIDNGTNLVLANLPRAPNNIGGLYRNLSITNTVTPNTTLNITADQLTLGQISAQAITVNSVSVTVNNTISGAGGIDTGSVGASTAYDIYIGYNPATATVSAWATVEGNATTPPSGYVYYKRFGWQRTDASKNWYRIQQFNDAWQYRVTASTNTSHIPLVASGIQGNVYIPTYVTTSLVGLIPTQSISVWLLTCGLSGSSNNDVLIMAPSNQYGPADSYPGVGTGNLQYDCGQDDTGGANIVTRHQLYFEAAAATIYIAIGGVETLSVCGGIIQI